MMAVQRAIELLEPIADPKRWELLGGYYYRCRGKYEKKWPHEVIQEALSELRKVTADKEIQNSKF